MVDDPDMTGSKTRKWSATVVPIQHTIDHVRKYIQTVILSQRWYCKLRRVRTCHCRKRSLYWTNDEHLWLGGSSYENYATGPQTDRCQHDVKIIWLFLKFCVSRKKKEFIKTIKTYLPTSGTKKIFSTLHVFTIEECIMCIWQGMMWMYFCSDINPYVPLYVCIYVYVCLCRGEWPGWSPSSAWPPVWH